MNDSAPSAEKVSGGYSLTAVRVVTVIFVTVSTVVVARLLGPAQYGLFAAGAAVGILPVTLFGPLGVDSLQLFGQLSIAQARRLMWIPTVVLCGLVLLFATLWPNLHTVSRVCAVLLGFDAVVNFWRLPWLIDPQVRLQFKTRAWRELLAISIATLAAIGIVLIEPTAIARALASLGAELVIAVLAGAFTRGKVALPPLWDVIRKGMPFAFSGVLYALYFQVDAALLAALSTTNQVGQYRIAYTSLYALVLFPNMLNGDVMRSRLLAATEELRPKIARQFLFISLALGVVTSGTLFWLGPPVFRLLFGTGYYLAAKLVGTIALSMLPHCFNSWAGNLLTTRGKLRWVISIQICMLAANLIANFALIPSHGAMGAAVSTIITEAAGMLLYICLLAVGRRRNS